MGNKYLGPAGIFSTDDRAADQRQIEAEQFDPDEYEEPTDLIEEDLAELEAIYYEQDEEQIKVFAGCQESGEWWDTDIIGESSFEEFKASKAEEHREKCPCGDQENFVCEKL